MVDAVVEVLEFFFGGEQGIMRLMRPNVLHPSCRSPAMRASIRQARARRCIRLELIDSSGSCAAISDSWAVARMVCGSHAVAALTADIRAGHAVSRTMTSARASPHTADTTIAHACSVGGIEDTRVEVTGHPPPESTGRKLGGGRAFGRRRPA